MKKRTYKYRMWQHNVYTTVSCCCLVLSNHHQPIIIASGLKRRKMTDGVNKGQTTVGCGYTKAKCR